MDPKLLCTKFQIPQTPHPIFLLDCFEIELQLLTLFKFSSNLTFSPNDSLVSKFLSHQLNDHSWILDILSVTYII
jgi:hypothetical protein